MTDESGQSVPGQHRHAARQGARRRRATTASSRRTCTPTAPRAAGSDAIVASAQAHGVPVVSARQMLDLARRPQRLVVRRARLERQHADLHDRRRRRARTACGRWCRPASAVGALTGVTRDGAPIPTTTQTIKGVEYAFFDATAGDYEATYAVDDTAPVISNVAGLGHGRRHGHRHLDHRRGLGLARRLRHQPGLARLASEQSGSDRPRTASSSPGWRRTPPTTTG